MKNNFTPAPWNVLKILHPEPVRFLVVTDNIEEEVDFNIPLNKKILGKAPDMYQALRTILTYAELAGNGVVVQIARNIIEEVEGEISKPKVG